jgi:cytidylate kinase
MRILILLLLFCSCDATKRIQKIAEKNPQITRIIDSVKVKEYKKIDTVKITNKIDSFILESQKVITKVFRHNDTIRVFQNVKPDTVYFRETRIEIRRDEKKVKRLKNLTLFLLAVILVSFLLIFIFFKK